MSLLGWLSRKLEEPCRFYKEKKCPWADESSNVCTKDGGHYYSHGQGGGCYRALLRAEAEGQI